MSEFLEGPIDPGQHRLVVVPNRFATNAYLIDARLDDIRENTPFTPEVIEEKSARAALDTLYNKAREGDVIYPMGGDTTAQVVAQVAGDKSMPNIGVMFSDLGNACNAYHSAVAPGYDGQPSRILQDGVFRDVFPLRARVEQGAEVTEDLELSIVSVGAIATGAAMLEEHRDDWLRTHGTDRTKLAYETLLSVMRGLTRTRTLEIADADGNNVRPALDVLVANVETIGKVAKFDTTIDEHAFLYGVIRNQLYAPRAIYELVHGSLPVTRVRANEAAVQFRLTTAPQNRRALIQLGGNVTPLSLGSLVTIDQPGADDDRHRPFPAVIARTA